MGASTGGDDWKLCGMGDSLGAGDGWKLCGTGDSLGAGDGAGDGMFAVVGFCFGCD